MQSASYLVLETPRAGNLGYRRLVSVGGLSLTNLTEALREVQKSGAGGDAVEVARTVRQPTVAGVAGREGTERLVLVHSGLGRASAEVIAALRDRLESLLTHEVSALVQIPATWSPARDRLTIGHPDLDAWHGQLIALLPTHLQEPTPVSGTGEAQADPRLSSPKPLKTHPRISPNIIIVFAAGLIVSILAGVLFFTPRDPSATTAHSKQETVLINECWDALEALFKDFTLTGTSTDPLIQAMNQVKTSLAADPPLNFEQRHEVINRWHSAMSSPGVNDVQLARAGLFSKPPISEPIQQARMNRFRMAYEKLNAMYSE